MSERFTKLTKRTVDAAEAGVGRYVVWDTELRGFGLRVSSSGTKTYVVRYRPRNLGQAAGKRYVTLGRHGAITPDEARQNAKKILGSVASGADPARERSEARSAITVCDLIGLFIKEHVKAKRKAKTASGYTAILQSHVVPRLGKRAAEKVKSNEIAQLHLSLREHPYQANRVLAVVASMYSFAAKRGLVPKGTNPVEGIERFREKSRERYLTTEELARLGQSLRMAETEGLPWYLDADKPKSKHLVREANRRTILAPEATLAIRLLLFTGARLREILNLEWRHVDLDRGLILLPESKTGRKTIVMSDLVIDLLRSCPRRSAFVITGTSGDRPRSDLKKPWRAIKTHAELDEVRIHDLRHTFASIGAGASLGLPIVGKLLGHSQPATTARYAHLDADPVRRAADLIGSKLAEAIGPSGIVARS